MKRTLVALLLFGALGLLAQEAEIEAQLHHLRQLPDAQRVKATLELAIKIRRLPVTQKKEMLAEQLANLVTEGDPGQEALEQVATTLAQALREEPVPKGTDAAGGSPYLTLAQLARYEHVSVSLDDARFAAAAKKLEADDESRQHADFTLTDLSGEKWELRALAGKVVLVNFWATWCPPCRKEMPDLDAIYGELSDKGLVILAISDEERGKVAAFVAEHKVSY